MNLAQAYAILKINRAERIGTRSYHRYLEGVEGTLAARNFSDSSNFGNALERSLLLPLVLIVKSQITCLA